MPKLRPVFYSLGNHERKYPAPERRHWLKLVRRSDVVLLDGETLPGLKDIIRQKCPNARLWCLSDAPDDLRKQLSAMTVSEDTLRGLYRRLLRGGTMAASALAQDCGMTEEQVLTGLTVFGQVALVSFKLDPYQLTLLPMQKVTLTDSPLRKYLITHYAAETQM